MGTEMGVVQRIVGQVGPQDPEDLASMRAADLVLDELNGVTPARGERRAGLGLFPRRQGRL